MPKYAWRGDIKWTSGITGMKGINKVSEIAIEYKKIIALESERCHLKERLEEVNREIERTSFFWEIDEDGLAQRVLGTLDWKDKMWVILKVLDLTAIKNW